MDFKKLEQKAKRRVLKNRGEQVCKEREAIAERHGREDFEPYWHTVVFMIIAFLGIFASGSTGLNTHDASLGWTVFVCTVVVPIALAVLVSYLRERFAAERRITPPTPESLKPSRVIPPYLLDEVQTLQEELIGKKSRYQRTKSELEEINTRARKAREQLELRCQQSEALYLRETCNRADEVIRHSDAVLEALKRFRAKVETFLEECRGTIKGIDPALRDLELVREVNDLHARTLELEVEAQQVIIEIVGELQTRMLGVKTDALSRFTKTGIKLSLENPEGEPLHSLTLLEASITTFTPNEKTDS